MADRMILFATVVGALCGSAAGCLLIVLIRSCSPLIPLPVVADISPPTRPDVFDLLSDHHPLDGPD